MNFITRSISLIACSFIAALTTMVPATVVIDYVRVGHPNNAADTTGYGSVDHHYRIGKYEVTNAQYGEFLNAKGQSNANGIYNSSMSSYGITQSGSSGSYTYSVTSGFENKPVVYVSWFDAARFANWMSNGQGNGDMETGAYTLNGATSGIITVNLGAKVYIPSENEWYKAAYYNGATSTYSLYPNGQNTITTADANYANSVGSTTNVGAYSSDPSFYGTFDQGGNVWEWNDAIISESSRGLRGGAWSDDNALSLSSTYLNNLYETPTLEQYYIGFRLAAASVDTDSDGLDDLAETNTGIYVSPIDTGTNPNSADTDADGVPDGLEVKEKTSPVDATKFNSFSKGLVAYYPFNGNAMDTTGNGNTGTEASVTYMADRFSGSGSSEAAKFSVTSSVEVPSLVNLSFRPTTYSMWIKFDQMPPSGGATTLIGRMQAWNQEDGALMIFNTLGYSNELCYYTGGDIIGSGFRPQVNQWYNISFVYTSEGMASFYVDGILASSIPFIAPQSLGLPFRIGASSILDGVDGNDTHSVEGSIDDVRIYNRAIAPTEVADLYSSERPHFQIIQGSYTWHEAKADAEARGGRLAVLNTQANQLEVSSLLPSSSQNEYFIGATDEVVEGIWTWLDGSIMSYSNWGGGEPNGDNYLAITTGGWGGIEFAQWNDTFLYPSDNNHGYILEFPDPKSVLTITSLSQGSISGAGEYDPGTSATLTATPDAGYTFIGWTGDASGTTNPLTLTMDTSKTVGATFVEDTSDPDSDGLTNYQEIITHGSNPDLADTDGDGLSDGEEITRGTNPLLADTDGDGLSDGEEITRATNPLLADTDGDGLGDLQEITITLTNPLLADSNANGLSDSLEDTDGDGILSGREVNELGTNPLLPDSDSNGLSDTYELIYKGETDAFKPRIGDRIRLDLKELGFQGTHKLVGKLPIGLTFNPLTGIIEGKLTGKPLTSPLTIQVLNGTTVVRSIPLSLPILAFPASLAGSWQALVENEDGQPEGMIRVVITSPGLWSASYDGMGTRTVRSSKGQLDLTATQEQATWNMTFPPTKASKTAPSLSAVTMTMSIDGPTAQAEGDHVRGSLRGFRLARGAELPAATKTFTLLIDHGVQDGFLNPAGMGTATGTLSNKGIISLAGQFGDAQIFKASFSLGATGQALIWLKPYKNVNSYIGGLISLKEAGFLPPSPLHNEESRLVWYRAADATELAYPAGFEPLLANVGVCEHRVPVSSIALSQNLGLPDQVIRGVVFDGGGLPDPTAQAKLPESFAIDAKYNLIALPQPGSPMASWKGLMVAKTGGFTGTLGVVASNTGIITGSAPVSGVLFPTLGSKNVGAGLVKIPISGRVGEFRTGAIILGADE